MTGIRLRSVALVACAAALGLGSAVASTPAWGAAGNPLFVYTPAPPLTTPPPGGYLDGPCGLTVTSSGNFYLSDHYHHAVDLFTPVPAFISQPLLNPANPVDHTGPVDDPCGLALDASGNLYLNNFHRSVVRFPAPLSLATGTVIAGFPLDSSHPTGVAVDPGTNDVYVDQRTYLAAFDSTGTPLEEGGEPVRIALDSSASYYGLAASGFPGTSGYLYVPDAATNTVKVFDPSTSTTTPVQTLSPPAGFTSLRDSAIAIDRVSGSVYVVDNLQPTYTEQPQAQVDVFSAAGTFLGVLKYRIVDAQPPGLAVDNSKGGAQGRVYVTSGNTDLASVYAYPPTAQIGSSSPPVAPLSVSASESGGGAVTSDLGGLDCATSCTVPIRSGADVRLTATSAQDSTFSGWSGGGCSGAGSCTVQMGEATAVTAFFEALPASKGNQAQTPPQAVIVPGLGVSGPMRRHPKHHRHRSRHRRSPHLLTPSALLTVNAVRSNR